MAEEDFVSVKEETPEATPARQSRHKKTDDGLDHKTLFVRSIPFDATSEELSDFFAQFAPVRHAVIVTDNEKNSRGFGFVSFSMDEDTQLALEKSRQEKFKNRLLRIDIAKRRDRKADPTEPRAKPEHTKQEVEKRKARLIIRNLPWSIRQPEQLKRIFQKYGAITDVIIPRKNGGRMSGFAFITMKKNANAENAIKQSSGLKIDGREVAVDFAIEKSKWEKYVDEKKEAEAVENGDDAEIKEESDVEIKDESDDEIPEDSDDEEDEEDEEDEADKELADLNDISKLESDAEGDEEDEEEEEDARPKQNKRENYSIFVRNIPYDATEETLKEHFEQFGPVKYALPVIDRETGLAKGTAFVAFYKEETYNEVLESAPEQASTSILIADDVSPLYVYEGRILSIAPTVDRESAERLQEKSSAKRKELLGKAPGEKDKRNLFLLNEGRITSKSKLASLISQTDMIVREKSYNLRVQQLNKNPTLHMSLTRLAIRNLPRAMTAKSLKQLGRKAVLEFAKELKGGLRQPLSKEELSRSTKHREFMGELINGEESNKTKKKGVVRQAKIIMEVKGSGEAGRSRGYGFLEFKDHRSALMALRWLNAHEVSRQEILEPLSEEEKKYVSFDDSKKRRLIVEFAIENAQVIKRRIDKVSESRKQKGDDKEVNGKRKFEKDDNESQDKPASKKQKKQGKKNKGNMNKGPKQEKKVPEVNESKVSDDVKKIIGNKRKRKQQKGK